MRIAAAILTRNQYEYERRDLFEQTVDSLKAAGVELYVVDNGSTDGTDKLVQSAVDWKPYLSTDPNTTSGNGTWTACRVLAGSGADLLIASDDDMVWMAGFAEPLTDWWQNAPEELTLTGGHLEPEFHWNHIEGHACYGFTHGLLRASTGAASWTFTRKTYDRLGLAARNLPVHLQGYWDVPMCKAIRDRGWSIGQLDLAEHAGQGRSSWGNRTEDLHGWDTSEVKAKLP